MKHQTFFMRLACLAIVVGLLLAYQAVTVYHGQQEQIAQLKVQVKEAQDQAKAAQASASSDTSSSSGSASSSSGFKDGTYTGSAKGFGGKITLAVTVKGGSIKSIDIKSAPGEDASYFSMAKKIIPNIIDAQSPDVDTISGATYSSTGIKNAVIIALQKAS